jgi:hypothetical protein
LAICPIFIIFILVKHTSAPQNEKDEGKGPKYNPREDVSISQASIHIFMFLCIEKCPYVPDLIQISITMLFTIYSTWKLMWNL